MSNSAICIDASIVVDRVLRPRDAILGQHWQQWKAERRLLIAPELIYYEVTNALYQKVKTDQITEEQAQKAIRLTMTLPIRFYNTASLHERALRVARELRLGAAYDAHYIALAWQQDAELWTRDARLVRAAQDKYDWVRLLA